jgi:hypothetical protein
LKDFLFWCAGVASYFGGIILGSIPIVWVGREDFRAHFGAPGVIALAAVFGPLFGMWLTWHWKVFKKRLPETRWEWAQVVVQGALVGAIPTIIHAIR